MNFPYPSRIDVTDLRFTALARSAQAINQAEKREDPSLTVVDREDDVYSKTFIISLHCV